MFFTALTTIKHYSINFELLTIFLFQDYNKVHINVLKCPRLLADKIMNVFPALNIRKEHLKLIKLSYNNYMDQNRGQLDVNNFQLNFSQHFLPF